MKLMLPDGLEAGMVLAETVYSSDGRVLLTEGTELTTELINRLKAKGVIKVSVNDENTLKIDPTDVLINRVLSEAMEVLGHFLPADIPGERLGEAKERYDTVTAILDKVVRDEQVAKLYLDLRTADDDTLDHSVTVCVLALIMGTVFKMPEERLLLLGKSALVHDIGKKAVSPDILAKREDLTPQEIAIFREHTTHGYHILREHGFDLAIARVALYHHERWDGSGYVNKITGETVDFSTRVIAVADMYDDLTRGLTYKQKYLPHEAVEFLYGAGGIYFDARVVKSFTNSICSYPLGSIVRLSTGEIGIVVNVQKTMAPRPIIKIFYDKNNCRLDYPRQVDLSEERTIFINKIL